MKRLILIILVLGIFSCKKDETKPSPTTPTDTTKYYTTGVYDIYVNSNYMLPYLTVERGGSAGVVINKRNSSGYPTDTAEVHYVLNANVADKYRAYTQSYTVAGKMFDSNPVWNRLTVVHKGDTIYNMLNDANYSGPTSAGNVFDFTVK